MSSSEPRDPLQEAMANVARAEAMAAVPALKPVQVFQATIKTKSGKTFQLLCPVEADNNDILDLIFEISLNLSDRARAASATSKLIVPSGPLTPQS